MLCSLACESDDEEPKGNAKMRMRRRYRRHLWSTMGLCGSAFSMFYLIMNVFPYSGFFAMHLLNSESVSCNNDHAIFDNGSNQQHPLYVAANIGPYAGLLASSFRLGRIPTAIPWGKCADVYGRKFALIVGIVAMVVGNLLFGLAPTFAAAVGIRFCTGLLNGTMVVVRSAISEIAEGDPELESRGVAMLSSMSGYGMLIGPAIGGLLSDPIKQYPIFFQDNIDKSDAVRSIARRVLENYPFLLPNLIGSGVAFLSLLTVLLCVEETLPDDQRRDWRLIPSDIGSWIASMTMIRRKSLSPSLNGPEGTIPISEKMSLISPQPTEAIPAIAPPASSSSDLFEHSTSDGRNKVNNNCNSSIIQTFKHEGTTRSTFASFFGDNTSNLRYFFYSMWCYAFTSLASLETFPLFAIASTANGGLGLDEMGIGIVQTIGGCIFVLGQYTVFTFATKSLGLMKALRISALSRSFLLILFPMALYISPTSQDNHDMKWFLLGYLGLVSGVISILGSIFMGCSTIGVNGCIKDASQRASLNGLQSMIASMGRGLGPIFSGYLVAVTMTSGVIPSKVSAWVVYAVLMIMEAITYFSTRNIPDSNQDNNDDKNSSYNMDNDDEEGMR